MGPIWWLRMAKWARHPPSDKRIKLVAAVILICLLLLGIEWLGYWPDWARAQRTWR